VVLGPVPPPLGHHQPVAGPELDALALDPQQKPAGHDDWPGAGQV
jgi:hypothetical protein